MKRKIGIFETPCIHTHKLCGSAEKSEGESARARRKQNKHQIEKQEGEEEEGKQIEKSVTWIAFMLNKLKQRNRHPLENGFSKGWLLSHTI